jgi:hypothetical protein
LNNIRKLKLKYEKRLFKSFLVIYTGNMATWDGMAELPLREWRPPGSLEAFILSRILELSINSRIIWFENKKEETMPLVVWLVIVGAILGGIFIFSNQMNSTSELFRMILSRREGKIGKQYGILPSLNFSLDGDKATCYITPGKETKLCLLVNTNNIKNHVGLWITEQRVAAGKITTGNQEFDKKFTISKSSNVTQDDKIIISKITPDFQQKILNLKEETCREIANQFIEIHHPNNSSRIIFQINNFFLPKTLGKVNVTEKDINRIKNVIDKLSQTYLSFKATGPM